MLNIFRSIFERLQNALPLRIRSFFESKTVKNSSEPLLTGVPLRPRIKTYSGATGFVYQYVYQGQHSGSDGITFAFSATSDRKTWTQVSVFIDHLVLEQLKQLDTITLTDTECYAVAKLTLFEFFDQTESLVTTVPLRPDANAAKDKLNTLGLL